MVDKNFYILLISNFLLCSDDVVNLPFQKKKKRVKNVNCPCYFVSNFKALQSTIISYTKFKASNHYYNTCFYNYMNSDAHQ